MILEFHGKTCQRRNSNFMQNSLSLNFFSATSWKLKVSIRNELQKSSWIPISISTTIQWGRWLKTIWQRIQTGPTKTKLSCNLSTRMTSSALQSTWIIRRVWVAAHSLSLWRERTVRISSSDRSLSHLTMSTSCKAWQMNHREEALTQISRILLQCQ